MQRQRSDKPGTIEHKTGKHEMQIMQPFATQRLTTTVSGSG
jgi:hypothetical protein